ncbi:DUF1476 domain-containing protein [Pelagibacterium halotolerans]|uniref:DUF1476 domain-containing protein n=1 Tax=Pelagibacterium halotolerans TaxID=531813 RepID=UPI00384F7F30
MSTFEERERGEEAKFAHDANLRFKAEARRNKHLAYWACTHMGIEDADARANYVAEIIAVDMTEAGPEDVVRKVLADFEAKGVDISDAEIRTKVAEFDMQAKKEILSEA